MRQDCKTFSKFGVKSIFESKRSCRRPPEKCEFPTLFRTIPRPELPGAPRSSPGAPPELPPELPGVPRFFWKKTGFRHFPSKIAQNEAPLPKQPLSDIFHRNLRKMKVFCHYNRCQTCSPEFAPQKKTAAAAVHPHIARKTGSIGNSASTHKLGPHFNLAFFRCIVSKGLVANCLCKHWFFTIFCQVAQRWLWFHWSEKLILWVFLPPWWGIKQATIIAAGAIQESVFRVPKKKIASGQFLQHNDFLPLLLDNPKKSSLLLPNLPRSLNWGDHLAPDAQAQNFLSVQKFRAETSAENGFDFF